MRYHDEGLSVIPIAPHDKRPALSTWEEYQFRQSTATEIRQWWGQADYNIGAVHGPNGYAMIDIDHNAGAMESLKEKFPRLMGGRIELSGGGAGYHVPMFLERLPELGWDNSKQRPKGNKTWRTPQGDVNIRARYCQTVLKPSIHPSGRLYEFWQEGDIVRLPDVDGVIEYLNGVCPAQAILEARHVVQPTPHGGPLDIKAYFPDVLGVFQSFGMAGDTQAEGGEVRILGNGGLLIQTDKQVWYSFREEMGGDVVDAFGFCLYGGQWNRYDKKQFLSVMTEMKLRAGIGYTRASAPVASSGKQSAVWGLRSYWRTR